MPSMSRRNAPDGRFDRSIKRGESSVKIKCLSEDGKFKKFKPLEDEQ